MANYFLINAAGLLSDISGTILLFIYGVPESISKSGNVAIILEEPNEGESKKWVKYNRLSKIALALLIIGFSLQLTASYLGYTPMRSKPSQIDKSK